MSANDRLKRRSDAATWAGMALATVLHFLVFAFSPTWMAEARAESVAAPEIIRLDEIDIPEAPEALPTPARPVPAPDVAPDVTIAPTDDWTSVPEAAPPPQSAEGRAGEDGIIWAPMTTPPRLQNPDEVARRLEREYPPHLRDAGIGGTVTLYVRIDDAGTLLETRVGASAGYDALDRAALAVAEAFRFSPAWNRDRRVGVWIALPVTFRAR